MFRINFLFKLIFQKTLEKVSGKTVSLLCDGCSRWGTKYQGFIIFTAQRLFVFSVFDIPYNGSMTLAKLIASVVKRLSDNKTIVVSVCTDNAKYNVSALNANKNSAQQLSGEYFILQPCATHTANIALKDLFHPKDKSNINNENLHC